MLCYTQTLVANYGLKKKLDVKTVTQSVLMVEARTNFFLDGSSSAVAGWELRIFKQMIGRQRQVAIIARFEGIINVSGNI